MKYQDHVGQIFLATIIGLLSWLALSVNDLNRTMVQMVERVTFDQQKIEDHEARLRYLESKK